MDMNIDSRIFKEDLEMINLSHYIDWSKLQNKTVLITGGTGLIGSTVIKALLYVNEVRKLNVCVLALVRSAEKAKRLFGNETDALRFIVGSVEELPTIVEPIDYIIHGASPTASLFFVNHPVETIQIATMGTMRLLMLAHTKKVGGFVYLSSMEVYGAPKEDTLIPELQGCTLDSMSVRSCYPIAKRLCETLCASYVQEYRVPAKVVRLAQTFGPGVARNDKRVFAEFARNAMNKTDIVLQTAGTSKREYLYTADSVTAILTVLLHGASGEAYNAGNPETYCSIREMAQLVAEQIAGKMINVHVAEDTKSGEHKFPPAHHLHLDVSKLTNIGWQPTRGLKEMYKRMIAEMEERL